MKPINIDEPGCSPISSNCIIWQGPDIPCIKLCKGDTVSIVVYKLAVELCKLIDMFNIDQYTLTCLNVGNCGPKDFQALIQLLIDRICSLENIQPTPDGTTAGCPNCVVTIAECFYYQNPQGDIITTMELQDYVIAIGNRICSLAAQIVTMQAILENHETRITNLENAPAPVVVLPKVTPVCVTPQPGVSQDMNVVLSALEIQFCELIGATGGAVDIYAAIAQQCPDLLNSPQLAGSGVMGTIPGWQTTVSNLADAISNLWLTICDIRSSILNIQNTCCPNNCDSVNVTLYAALTDPTTLKLYFNGTIPVGFAECNPSGTVFVISDQSGGTITITVPVIANLNNMAGYTLDLTSTPLNTAENLTITASAFCLTDGTSQCQSTLQYIVVNTALCPVLQITPGETTISYQYGWISGPVSIDVQVWDQTQTVMIASQVTGVGGPGTYNGVFSGLTAGMQYNVRCVITSGDTTTPCPFVPTTTIPAPCLPATSLVATIDL